MTLRLVVRPGFQAERWRELSAALGFLYMY